MFLESTDHWSKWKFSQWLQQSSFLAKSITPGLAIWRSKFVWSSGEVLCFQLGTDSGRSQIWEESVIQLLGLKSEDAEMAAFSHHMSQPLPSVSPRTPQVTTQRKATLDTARSRLMRSYVGDSMRRSKKRRKKNMQKFVLSHPSEEIKIEMLLSQGQEPSQEDGNVSHLSTFWYFSCFQLLWCIGCFSTCVPWHWFLLMFQRAESLVSSQRSQSTRHQGANLPRRIHWKMVLTWRLADPKLWNLCLLSSPTAI